VRRVPRQPEAFCLTGLLHERDASTAAFLVPRFSYGLSCAGIAVLVLPGLAPPLLVAFGVVDAAGALWTRAALRG
jgi:hypothetical protein